MVPSVQNKPQITRMSCRLCNGESLFKFESLILNKRLVQYFECTVCDSLQTEFPDWLELAYEKNLAASDIGAAQRTLRNLVVSYFLSRITKSINILDIGGGDGLLCRFLRDYGCNSFVMDKYSHPIYAQQFTAPTFDRPEIVLAYEVLEHFANPLEEIKKLFSYSANFYLFSTSIYTNQTKDWWYLTPSTGQHIFFYSRKAVRIIAERYGFNFMVEGNLILFYKTNTLNIFQRLMIRVLLTRPFSWLLRSVIVLLPTKGNKRDQQLELFRTKSRNTPDSQNAE